MQGVREVRRSLHEFSVGHSKNACIVVEDNYVKNHAED